MRWFPYQPHPEAPAEAIPYRELIERKYGRLMIDVFARLTAAGKAVGIEFQLDRIARGANTLNAHRVIEWARAAGCEERAMVEPGSKRISAPPGCRQSGTLAVIAGEVGLRANTLAERLAGPDGRTEVLDRMAYSRDQASPACLSSSFAGHTVTVRRAVQETFLHHRPGRNPPATLPPRSAAPRVASSGFQSDRRHQQTRPAYP
ncbi:MAG: DsbA family protein [Gammaproteobacteria bacterium]|nr:DsbA family protein [Gammaproteobacteria bacterium]